MSSGGHQQQQLLNYNNNNNTTADDHDLRLLPEVKIFSEPTNGVPISARNGWATRVVEGPPGQAATTIKNHVFLNDSFDLIQIPLTDDKAGDGGVERETGGAVVDRELVEGPLIDLVVDDLDHQSVTEQNLTNSAAGLDLIATTSTDHTQPTLATIYGQPSHRRQSEGDEEQSLLYSTESTQMDDSMDREQEPLIGYQQREHADHVTLSVPGDFYFISTTATAHFLSRIENHLSTGDCDF